MSFFRIPVSKSLQNIFENFNKGIEKECTQVLSWTGASQNEGEKDPVDLFATRPKGIPATRSNDEFVRIFKCFDKISF